MSSKTRQPEVTLLSITKDPLEVMAKAIDIWHHQDFDTRIYTEAQLINKFEWLLKQPHQTPMEFVHTVWIFHNVSRAFQQQLTRHRVGFSYSIQSLRVVDAGKFASEGRYTCPSTMKKDAAFHFHMKSIENVYNEFVKHGDSIEDSRGLLPLNIHSPIMMACSYRALVGMLRQRLCVAAQEEWSLVASRMREEISKVHEVLTDPLDCMCGRLKRGKGVCKTLHKEVEK